MEDFPDLKIPELFYPHNTLTRNR